MKKLFLGAAVLAVVACGQRDEIPATVLSIQSDALAGDVAWQLLESLTTEVGPRMGGSPGDALAVAWARQKLVSMGFDQVWLEHVEFPRWVRRAESARMVSPRLQDMAVTALGGSPGTDGVLNAELVHFTSLADLESADPSRVAGKIAFISKQTERRRDGSGYGESVVARSRGPYVAARKGALALIIRSIGTDNNRTPHTGMMSTTEPGVPVPSAAISSPDADILLSLLARRSQVIVELELDCGFDGTAISQNVIGQIHGRDKVDEFVVVGGHLDSWDLGTGAIDDGTGVAITMAAAAQVGQLQTRPRRGVRVVLFANEEQGIYGGKAYAQAHANELDMHVLGAESDLGSGRIYQFRSRVNEAAEPALLQLASWLVPLGVPLVRDKPASGGADLGQMRKIGMPVVDLNHDASEYFDLHHTANDTLDKVDPADLRHNVAVYATFIYFAAESDSVFGPVAPSP